MKTVAIIGAGFCGTIAAAHLLRTPVSGGLRVCLINRPAPGHTARVETSDGGNMARGLAYGTQSPLHLLNVPVGRMSAFADRPDDFFDFLERRGQSVTRADFVSRSHYGAYLADTLKTAEAFGRSVGNVLEKVSSDIISLSTGIGGSYVLTEADGTRVNGDSVLLALGNFKPATPPSLGTSLASSPRYVGDPWAPNALEGVSTAEPVLLIGTGLTMYDMAISLDAQHRQQNIGSPLRVVALSRRGLLPQAHRNQQVAPETLNPPTHLVAPGLRARHLLRYVREQTATPSGAPVDWRDLIAALRPITPSLWGALALPERRRFLRHLRPYWDSHRHRAAPPIAAFIASSIARGVLVPKAARILSASVTRDAVTLTIRARGATETETLTVGTVINCTGPSDDLANEPLLRALMAEGRIRRDTAGLGIEVAPDYRLLDAAGQPQKGFFYVGPLLKAQFWEATAVPELREHTANAAAQIVSGLSE